MRRLLRCLSSCVTVAVLLPAAVPPAAAQPPGPAPVIETVTVTGGAHPVAFRELPRTVRVVTRGDIAHLPVATVTDLLRLVASADVRARGPRGIQADVGVRGAGFGQVLVLVDGVRFNNLQTGHHNSDLPISLDDIERVEILLGPGSSAFGADAFGGTVNLITRRGASPPRVSATVGQHGLADVGASAGFASGPVDQRLSGRLSRSSGFEADRDFRSLTLSSATRIGARTRISAGFVDKAFGANGFYGPSPSREWTRLWSAAAEHRLVAREGLDLIVRSSYRAHRDRFLWDRERPGLFENTHRTQAFEADVRLRWRAAPALEVGAVAELAGDWMQSSNLGHRSLGRGAAAVDLQWTAGAATAVHAAVRVDRYSTFGSAVSPSLGVSRWLAPAWRVRASAGRAFRVPTFTERFYRDPAHQASPDLGPERAWAGDAGIDWLPSARWQAVGGVFRRWERDVIDWVRPHAATAWRTANLRRVTVSGVEAGLRWHADRRGTAGVDYAWMRTNADSLAALSKYTLDYPAQSVVLWGSGVLPGGVEAGGRVEYRQRVGRAAYTLTDVRVSRTAGAARLFVDATNVFGAVYQEIRGVAMPGRWVTAGVTFDLGSR